MIILCGNKVYKKEIGIGGKKRQKEKGKRLFWKMTGGKERASGNGFRCQKMGLQASNIKFARNIFVCSFSGD